MDWVVYLLECADGTLYCGVTNDLEKRIAAHNAGKGARYTRGRAPVRLVWKEVRRTRGLAQRREHDIKALTRAQKQNLISSVP